MGDQFNILDRKSLQYIASRGEPISIDGITTETELDRFIIPGNLVQNNTVLILGGFWTTIHAGGNLLSIKVYVDSISSGNEIYEFFSGLTGTRNQGIDKHFYIRESNFFGPTVTITHNTGNNSGATDVPITLANDLPVIFTGYMNNATPGDIIKLNGYSCSVFY